MATDLVYPPVSTLHQFDQDFIQAGKEKVPFRIKLVAEQYSNNAETRANGGTKLAQIILPMPTGGFNNSVDHTYNQAPAKEEAVLVKLFSGEAKSLFRDAFNFIGKQFQDALTTVGGIDYGRVPADMSESTYSGTEKRGWNFKWDLVALNKGDSTTLMDIADLLTSYSLPGARASSDRAQAPPVWRIYVLGDGGGSPAKMTKTMLGDPKLSVLTNCRISRDMSVLYGPGQSSEYPTPLNVSLSLSFQEIEPVYGQDGNIRSRAEVRTGGGLINA